MPKVWGGNILAPDCSIDACFHLGHLYEIGCSDKQGIVLQSDVDMAIRFYKEAGQKVRILPTKLKGHIKSLLRLASILICGPERVKNLKLAVEYLKKVAMSTSETVKGSRALETLSKDTSDAQNMLGELCEMGLQDGPDGSADAVRSLEWYRLALKSGHDRAMFNLGSLYERGEVVTRDLSKALKLYQESAKRGNEDAKTRLVDLEELGVM